MARSLNLSAMALCLALAVTAPLAHARNVSATVVEVERAEGQVRRVCDYDDRRDSRYPRDRDRVTGTVTGAVIGGALGNQVGDGNGRAAATVAGAVIGGLAGREIQDRHQDRYDYDRYEPREEHCWTERERGRGYDVTYRLDNGHVFTERSRYAPRLGSRVRVQDPRW